MLKTHSLSDNKITLSWAVWIGLGFVLCIVCIVLFVFPVGKKQSQKLPLSSSTRAFIDTQKIEKVYKILVPD